MIKENDEAPDFVLKDQYGKELRLSDVKGKRVLLSFHPLAWTSVCADQMKSLEDNIHTFEKLKTLACGISVDSVPSKKAWAEHLGITGTRLLSDFWPHGQVAKLYGIFRDDNGFSERANIIVNEDRKVVLTRCYPISQLPDIGEILSVLEGM